MIRSRYSGIFLSIITIAGLTVSAYLVARDTSLLKGVKTQVQVTKEDPIANFVGTQLSRPQRTLETPVAGSLSRWSNREREHQDESSIIEDYADAAQAEEVKGQDVVKKSPSILDIQAHSYVKELKNEASKTPQIGSNSSNKPDPTPISQGTPSIWSNKQRDSQLIGNVVIKDQKTLTSTPVCSEAHLKHQQASSSTSSEPTLAFCSAAEPLCGEAHLKHQQASSSTSSEPALAFCSAAEPLCGEAHLKHQQASSSTSSEPSLTFCPPAEPLCTEAHIKHQQASSSTSSEPALAFCSAADSLCAEAHLKHQQASSNPPSQPTQSFCSPADSICGEAASKPLQANSPTTSQPNQIFSSEPTPTPVATTTVGMDLSSAKGYHVNLDDGKNEDPRLKPRIGAPIIKTQSRLSGTSDLSKEKPLAVETSKNETTFVAQYFIRPPSHHTVEENTQETTQEIAQATPPPVQPPLSPPTPAPISAPTPLAVPKENAEEETLENFFQQEAFINFNNVAFVQYLNFISKLTGKNFVFDEADLDFKVTIMSNKPTTIEFVMTALLQELRIHNLSLMEVGNTLIIHRNNTVNALGTILGDNQTVPEGVELITQVFSLGNTKPSSLLLILQPMLSPLAILETSDATNHLILTDIAPNVKKVAELIDRLDTPFTGYEVGQHVVVNASLDGALQLVEKLMAPIAGETPITFIPHLPTNSIFVVSTRYLVERAMGVLEKIDNQEGKTRLLSIDKTGPKVGPSTKIPPEEATLEFIRNFLKGMTPEELANFLSQTNLQLENNPDLLRALQKINLTDTQREQLKRDMIRFLNGLSQEDKKTLRDKGMEGLYPGTGIKTPPKPEVEPAGLRKENELKKELQDDFDYLSPEERTFILNANKAQEQDQLGQVRSKLLNEDEFFFDRGTESQLGKRETRTARPTKKGNWQSDLPIGHVESTEFAVYKLDFRNGEEIVKALTEMATSLSNDISGESTDLIASINSIQYIKSSNSLLITGTKRSLAKVRDIISLLDLPIRQVLIELLLLQTTLSDSLNYGVDWGSRFGGTSSAGGQTFASSNSNSTAFVSTLSGVTGDGSTAIPVNSFNFLANSYSLGVIGRNIRRGPLVFDSIGALVSALHTDTISEVVMNPKIVVEDNASAEVFVGVNTAYATDVVTFGQSGSNNNTQQSIEFRDIGSSLKVSPRIGHNDVITLTIEQQVSDESTSSSGASGGSGGSGGSGTGGGTSSVSSVGPTTNKSTTKTIVHMPNGYFLILGGMIQSNKKISNTQIPCLGGLPGLGGAFRSNANTISKNNLMIFIRPTIIEDQEIHVQTKRQQDVMREHTRHVDRYEYEVDQALEFLNLQETDEFIR